MFKLIRDNQKKVLAGVGVVLMISFVGGYGGGGGRSRQSDRQFGTATVGRRDVLASEVVGAQQELQAVNQYTRQFDPSGASGYAAVSLVDRVLRQAAGPILRRPELFALLRREAAVAGPGPDPQQVQSVLDASLAGPDGQPNGPAPDSDEYAALRAGVGDLILVGEHFARMASAFKASRPAVDHMLGTDDQQVQLNLVPVPAAAFDAAVTPPSQDQLAAQFHKYAAVSPGRPDAGNPFGFGYRVPRRVTLQYLRLSYDAVEKAVAATKSDFQWDVAARKVYYAQPERFTPPLPPTTSPAINPPPKLPPQPYPQVRDQAIHIVRDPLVQQLQDQVQQFLSAALARDYEPYAAAVRDGHPAPATPLGIAYDGPGYLLAVATAAEAKFKVHVDTDQTPPLSVEAVANLPGIGTARAGPASSATAGGDGSLAGYVADRAEAFLDHPEPRTPAATADLMQPSPAFNETATDTLDLARVTSVTPSAPAADLDAVRSAVDTDCRLAAAYALAQAKADRLVAVAHDGTMAAVADAAGLRPIPTQPLTLQTTAVDGLKPPLADAAADFMTAAFGLLDGYDPARNPHPAKVIPVPAQRRLFVAQLQFVNARWTPADYYRYRLGAAARLRDNQANVARQEWFSPDAIVDRTGFKSSANTGS